jgi:hypothetical protein
MASPSFLTPPTNLPPGGTAEAGRSAATIRPTRRRLPARVRRRSCFRNSSCRAGAPPLVLGSRSLRLCCGSLTHGASILGRFGHHMHLPLAVGSIAHDILFPSMYIRTSSLASSRPRHCWNVGATSVTHFSSARRCHGRTSTPLSSRTCLFAELLAGRDHSAPYGWRCVLVTRTRTNASAPYARSDVAVSGQEI